MFKLCYTRYVPNDRFAIPFEVYRFLFICLFTQVLLLTTRRPVSRRFIFRCYTDDCFFSFCKTYHGRIEKTLRLEIGEMYFPLSAFIVNKSIRVAEQIILYSNARCCQSRSMLIFQHHWGKKISDTFEERK